MTVELEAISKSFGAVTVLHELSLTVAPAEFLVLLGPSGCGKTTALRMTAGLESVTSGRILINGENVTEVAPKNRDLAMVFQSYALYPHMTVAQNIGYPLVIRKLPRAEIERQVRETAAQVQLDALLERYPRQLSGGQRQRVALARAIVRRPAAFLMDEPLSNLDAKLRGHMRAELKHMQHELAITTIYVTHDQIEAMTLAHRVAVLNKGRTQQIDTPQRIYDDPANIFVAGFVGSPPMNFIAGDMAEGRFRGPDAFLPIALPATRSGVELGFRPEDCRVVAPDSPDCLVASIYSTELIGDHVLVTCRIAGQGAGTLAGASIVVKAEKTFDREIGAPVGIRVPAERTYLFDRESGERLRAGSPR
ncbi:MAG TPA: ABC transporter ATP-binding protein [Dongiaceae bacterium]